MLQLFQALGGNAEGLQAWQLKRFADLRGFAGSAADWARQYSQLCPGRGWRQQPMPVEAFAALLEEEDGPLHCDDTALQFILMALGSRQELIFSIFRALDTERDERLGARHLRRFAELCGFRGEDEEWAAEYEALIARYDWDVEHGVDAKAFAQMLNDPAGNGHCTEDELKVMIMELGCETFG